MKKESTVLIAEDDFASQELLKNKVEEHNRRYIAVQDGASAVEMIRKYPEVNLVFMDIRLPEIDGIEAMKQIKKLRKNIIVIAQTAYLYNCERDRQIYLDIGFDGFIEKPFNLDLISNILNRYR